MARLLCPTRSYARPATSSRARGIGLMNAYGQTESTSTLTYLAPEDHDLSTDTAIREHRLRSVGRPCPNVEIGIMDERNRLLGPNEEGEICVRSDRVMKATTSRTTRPVPRVVDPTGSTRATSARSMRGAISSSPAARKTSSSGAARTSLPARSRTARRPPEGGGGGGHRCAGPGLGRSRQGCPRPERRRIDDRRRGHRVHEEPAVVVQSAPVRAIVSELPRNAMGKVLRTTFASSTGPPRTTTCRTRTACIAPARGERRHEVCFVPATEGLPFSRQLRRDSDPARRHRRISALEVAPHHRRPAER